MSKDPQFDWWRNALQGTFGPKYGDGEDDIHSGYYRRPQSRDAIAFWRAEGELVCLVNGKPYRGMEAGELFNWCYRHPVTFAAYNERLEKGSWPDEHDNVTRILANAPDEDTFEGIESLIKSLASEADILITKGAAKTQHEADRAAHVATELGRLVTKADKLRETEKRPHLEAERAVDAKWRPMLDIGAVYKRIKAAIITPFLNAENTKREAEFRKQQEEASIAREKAEAEEELRQRALERHEADQLEALAQGQEPPPPPPELTTTVPEPMPVAEPEFVPATAGIGTRKISSRTNTRANITDYDQAVAFFKDRDEVKDIIQTLANRAAKAGVRVPGVDIVKEKVAA
jgi:hypothetical protein